MLEIALELPLQQTVCKETVLVLEIVLEFPLKQAVCKEIVLVLEIVLEFLLIYRAISTRKGATLFEQHPERCYRQLSYSA